jgi:gamma-tubulin complex component 3
MIHFVAELQAFCQLEAIELAWQDMVEFERSREGDLDALIAAHRTYLANIKAKALLLNPRDASDVSSRRFSLSRLVLKMMLRRILST